MWFPVNVTHWAGNCGSSVVCVVFVWCSNALCNEGTAHRRHPHLAYDPHLPYRTCGPSCPAGSRGFPAHHGPHFGCVAMECIKYIAPMYPSLHTYDTDDPLFRLNPDMWNL